MQALIDYNSQHLPELRLLYHNSTRCKWIFSHNLNFLRKKPFIFIKNYTFYFGKYITTYYLLMCRILQFPICYFSFLMRKYTVNQGVQIAESLFQTHSRSSFWRRWGIRQKIMNGMMSWESEELTGNLNCRSRFYFTKLPTSTSSGGLHIIYTNCSCYYLYIFILTNYTYKV